MQSYDIFVDELKKESADSESSYVVALIPSSRGGGAMGTRRYKNKETFVADLKRYLGYTDAAIERFLASDDRHHTLVRYALSEEDAAHLGWLPDYNKY